MKPNKTACLIVSCFIVGMTLALSAQNRPHDRIMKEVGPAFSSLRKNIDGKMGADAARDATKLADLFKEVEMFWTPLKSSVAVKAAKDMRDIAGKIAAVAATDLSQADALYTTAGNACKTCHDRHRTQLPDGSYRILP